MSPEQFERLPKYAQNEIQRLERNLEYLQGKMKEMIGGTEFPTAVSLVRPLTREEDVFLPLETAVRFAVEGGGWIEASRGDREVRLMASEPLLLELSASNVFYARLRER